MTNRIFALLIFGFLALGIAPSIASAQPAGTGTAPGTGARTGVGGAGGSTGDMPTKKSGKKKPKVPASDKAAGGEGAGAGGTRG